MKRALLVLVLAILFAGSACVAGDGLEGGNYWNAIEAKWGAAGDAVKTAYLLGILEGFHFMIDRADEPEGAPLFRRQDVERISSALDRLYTNPKNVKIPVVYALSIVNMQMRGVDTGTIERAIGEKRDFWDKARGE